MKLILWIMLTWSAIKDRKVNTYAVNLGVAENHLFDSRFLSRSFHADVQFHIRTPIEILKMVILLFRWNTKKKFFWKKKYKNVSGYFIPTQFIIYLSYVPCDHPWPANMNRIFKFSNVISLPLVNTRIQIALDHDLEI